MASTDHKPDMMRVAEAKIDDRYPLRPLREESVERLVESIKDIKLLTPLTVDQDGNLIAGLHRLEAARRLDLGWVQVRRFSIYNDTDRLKARRACIDENLVRCELTELERDEALAERKLLYEQLHPDAVAGTRRAAAANAAQGHDVGDIVSPTFAPDTAAKTGLSDRVRQGWKCGRLSRG